MTLDELKDAVVAVDPAAILVPGHLLARVIREVHRLGGQTITVPHRKSCILDRHILFRHVDPDDLELGSDRLLPPRIILLSLPSPDRGHTLAREATLLHYWRRLFHARVHLQLEQRVAEGQLGPAALEARLGQIGRCEFEEVRNVLQQEQYLFPDASPLDVYIEFAAVYLELRFFMPELLPVFFPAIRDPQRIDPVLERDVDVENLFRQTRVADLTHPPPRRDDSADEPTDTCWKLMREARRATRAKNTVRAALLRTRAARIAPAALTARLQAEVADDLDHLTRRLRDALKLSDTDVPGWRKDLSLLVEKAGDELWSVEAALLQDLQKACVDHEHEVFALDPVGWVLSAGRKPFKRALPNQRLVRSIRHLGSASQRLTVTRLSEADRQHLGQLLHKALHDNEVRLRGRLCPLLIDAVQLAGMQAANSPEQAALHKMAEELLDRIIAFGFFTYSDLRDAIARNDFKLPDLSDPVEAMRGDPLLRLDRVLAARCDGVYRPSEIYLRLIQRVTSVFFGTGFGRKLTRFVLLPFGLSLAVLEGIDLVLREYHKYFGGGGESLAPYEPLFSPMATLTGLLWPGFSSSPCPWLAPLCWVVLSLVLIGLLYVPVVQLSVRQAARLAHRLGRTLLVDLPSRLLPLPALRRVLKSWPVKLATALALKPLPISALIWLLVPETRQDWWRASGLFLAVTVVMNSRLGRTLEEVLSRLLLRFLGWLSSDLLYALVRLVLRLFKHIIDGVESIFHTVDEVLHVRAGEDSPSLSLRTVLLVAWLPLSYLARVYVVVLIEPGFNPLKAPLSILAAKVVYPLTIALGFRESVTTALQPFLGTYVANAFVLSTWWLLPDAVTFLIWETKENWKLYGANRRGELRPVGIGPHGETLAQLLRPGFHSGTLPKLYSRWREAERALHKGAGGSAARACREKLQRLEESLRRFVERDVLALVERCSGWSKPSLHVGSIRLASNLVRIELQHAEYPGSSVRLAIAEQGGRLVAQVEDAGWVRQLPPSQLATLERAIAGLYRLAGVDLVREQVDTQLPAGAVWTIQDGALVVRFEPGGPPRSYDLNQHEVLQARPNGPLVPVLDPVHTIFARTPIPWHDWVNGWERPEEERCLTVDERTLEDGKGTAKDGEPELVFLPPCVLRTSTD